MPAYALTEFVRAAPHGADRVLMAMAEAESLTDPVAERLYQLAPIEGVSASLFVKALHYSGFIAPRNSEWHLLPEVRNDLRTNLNPDDKLRRAANELLLEISETGSAELARTILPGYLFTSGGRGFHLAALGRVKEALSQYANAAAGPLTGQQWLADRLSDEQERTGKLPPGSIEVTFLRAMVKYREGRRREAEPLFRRLATSSEVRQEVAIATHLLANMLARRNPTEAERLCRQSVAMLEELRDDHGIAQSLHSLANILARERARAEEAEQLYRRSMAMLEELRDDHGIAQTLHSFANLLSQARSRAGEAEELYRRAIEIEDRRGDQHGLAQKLHSLANLLSVSRSRVQEAEELYRRSLLIGEGIGNDIHVAQTLHSLANLLSRDHTRAGEAEELYRRAISMLEKLRDQNGVAQTLRSFALLVENRSVEEAEELLSRSLEINRRSGNTFGEALVLRTLAELRGRHLKPS